VSLGEFRAVFIEQEGQVRKLWRLPTKGIVQNNMFWGRGKPLLKAQTRQYLPATTKADKIQKKKKTVQELPRLA
jgi:hypothetical protein